MHIDADFLAYMVAYDDQKSLQEMQDNCDALTEKMRLTAGAEFVKLHLTPRGSDKGDRYNIALLKEYQGNRKDKPKPKFLHVIREFMHKERGGVLAMNCEADDSMAAEQYKMIADGTPHLSVIATKDKDLLQVPGLQVNWDTGEITDTKDNPFGWITLDETKSTKKIRGRGWKYFWAQLLTGDSADNISGLPKCIHEVYTEGKLKRCGPVLAYNILKDVSTNSEAARVVSELYKTSCEAEQFVDYRSGDPITWVDALRSEMKLLWMRRNPEDTSDVLMWLKETK